MPIKQASSVEVRAGSNDGKVYWKIRVRGSQK